ncbi:MAG: hypothetical protein KZQ66_16335 [Candidatus Thiodiazotropha sp. (ex Lucinoma aequizonata)]|nr:hypothetical protein [Candidatus Thiodiazotropha sp. (ex Lucinoma aequizonata)]MCU7887334.1 hypothetical protein [Candidatus Thiodiazotropha sp. (ex Lucinoma aequizonata)]MCU7895767.1 hypothetical protein [Candidatus Thiodiazotropha sp. (ex Lucinoma aequizonata)]MCU7897216.1 hypothetical protein [Candidatus Thiodiazotropha sp. (ex Lucinoma aequizonata)]MCU7903365.1 hypothetical protein [Candidatus Thiodiazotropha sp. (ex Lucinoma aequizonata)]
MLYKQDRSLAGLVADKLKDLDKIGGYTLQIDIVSLASIEQYKNQQTGALFITDVVKKFCTPQLSCFVTIQSILPWPTRLGLMHLHEIWFFALKKQC